MGETDIQNVVYKLFDKVDKLFEEVKQTNLNLQKLCSEFHERKELCSEHNKHTSDNTSKIEQLLKDNKQQDIEINLLKQTVLRIDKAMWGVIGVVGVTILGLVLKVIIK